MFILRQGQVSDAHPLNHLILASEPTLLPAIFGENQAVKTFLAHALVQPDGQYSAQRHQVIVMRDGETHQERVVGSMTLWADELDDEFLHHTLDAIAHSCSKEQIKHIGRLNPFLQEVFLPPKTEQLALGHLSVLEDYQGLGLGKKLIAYVIRQAKLRGKQQVVLDVDCDNEQAVSFYLGCGFIATTKASLEQTGQTFSRMVYTV
ncbi:MAG: GNAT family N-acetyltransferase [Glaciecola sp.]|nr:GNAT family N-acetyltransferase [Glaciecola sp.]MDG2100293.1 GNAT family N-acetyltransferase [Glaciecola sp.]